MIQYEFVDVLLGEGLKAKKDEAFEKCKALIYEKSEEGWEVVQIIPVINEKMGVASILKYSVLFKKN